MEQMNEAMEQVHNTEGKHLKKGGKRFFVILCVVVAVLAAAYVGLCAYVNSLNTFAPNRHINGIDVGGLTVAEAQAKLEKELLSQSIEITNNLQDTQLTISVADLGYTAESFAGDAQFWMDADQMQQFLTKGWTFLCYWTGRYPGGYSWPDMDADVLRGTTKEVAEFFSWEPIHGSYELLEDAVAITRAKDGRTVNETALMTALANIAAYSKEDYRLEINCEILPAKELSAQEIYKELSGEMKNAAYDKETDSITAEQIGVEFSVAAAQKALDATEPGETAEVEAQIQRPAVTAAELEEVLFRDVLAEYTTSVSGTAARRSNVKLSAAAINGYIMNSGDVFSYNEAVGQRTAANGYQPAPAYIQGETVDEIGGGICQTSSTLYMACLLANLEITERYAHRYAPAYITLGMDATVSWGGPDYKFTNNTDYPVRIETTYENHKVTIRLLGTKTDDTYSKMTYEYLGKTDWQTVYQEDATVAPGTQVVKTDPYTGHKVKTYHTIYAGDGTVLDSHYEATSDYKFRNKVILVAPGELPGAKPQVPAVAPVETPQAPAQTAPEPSAQPETPVVSPETELPADVTETPEENGIPQTGTAL